MKIKTVLSNLNIKSIRNYNEEINVVNICDNSTNVKNGDLFVALCGTNTTGMNYCTDAINNGAVVVVCDSKFQDKIEKNQKNNKMCFVFVDDSRKAFAILCANFFDNAVKDLKIISVVGTNGKTSTAKIISNILMTSNKSVGVIGTNAIYFNNEKIENDMTTPDPYFLHKTFFEMRQKGIEFVVMEISAHAIYFQKVYGIKSECMIFTNFSQDHLDFFKTMENYKRTKVDYFCKQNTKCIVVNIDDEVGREILKKADVPCITYGIKNPSDIFALNISMNLEGSEFVVNMLDKVFSVKSNLTCLFNVYNILASISACSLFQTKISTIKLALKQTKEIEGRFNLIKSKQNFNIIVDYAHTQESLKNLLQNVKTLTKGKIITVFGCPGNRDELKREIMGEIAGNNSDYVVLTTDNPQYENSFRIMRNIEAGLLKTNCPYKMIDDRKDALMLAISLADNKSTIVVAGKGMEEYQNINGEHIAYNDKKQIEELLIMAKKLKLNDKFVY